MRRKGTKQQQARPRLSVYGNIFCDKTAGSWCKLPQEPMVAEGLQVSGAKQENSMRNIPIFSELGAGSCKTNGMMRIVTGKVFWNDETQIR